MGLDHDYRQWFCRGVGTGRTQNSTITYPCSVVVHRSCPIHCLCTSSHWCGHCEQGKDGVSRVPCVLRICLHHGCGNHLLVSSPTQRSRVFAVRLWWFVLDGSGHSRDVGGSIRLTNTGKNLQNCVDLFDEKNLANIAVVRPSTVVCERFGVSPTEDLCLFICAHVCQPHGNKRKH